MSGGAAQGQTWVRRFRWDGWALGVGLAVLLVSALLVRDPPAGWEVSAFRALNQLPHSADGIFWVLQRAGAAVVVPLAAIFLWWWLRHWRPAAGLVLGGFFLGWLAAKGVRALVGRGRPGLLLADSQQLGFDVPVDGVGFPSGHAVLAFTLAAAFSPYLSTRARWISYGLAASVALTRIYVGAHMPLDVIGGAAYGTIVGSVINLTVGIRTDREMS